MESLRVGLLGCGGIGARHVEALNELRAFATLVACCGRDEERTKSFAVERGGAAAYTDLSTMLANEKLDLLIVALPPFAHEGQVEAAARAGVHLLVEKPIALGLERAEAMVQAADEAGIVASCGFMHRFGVAVEGWEQALAADRTGRPGMFTGYFHCNSLHAPWWRTRELSGGQTVEQLIHVVDLARHTLGMPETVYARAANMFHQDVPGYDSEDVSAMILGYGDGRVGVLDATNSAIPGRWESGWKIIAEKMTGSFAGYNSAEFIDTQNPENVTAVPIVGERDVFVAQLQDVLEAIAGNKAPHVPLRDGLDSLRIVLAARQSADEGRQITL
ncbi:hypothetical protein GCM10007989_32970 [Devosia pacifica]|uniref:Dehydrogenase n=1 Tax=Devosia pacifica TaxID=1335967 RepID=A0A918VVW0_9HYPH|nr:Gfo/Idh/MocA family oxidoreductase [Devosia pacifica]GHA34544.1 hypothetical protein GCM10007989_32970 [Devosia pacifica]